MLPRRVLVFILILLLPLVFSPVWQPVGYSAYNVQASAPLKPAIKPAEQPPKLPPPALATVTSPLPALKGSARLGTVAQFAEVPGIFSLPVVQQPENNAIYVAEEPGLLTQFHLAEQDGVTGLLAHNYLAGSLFNKLILGQVVTVHYTDDHLERFRVTSIQRFQKLHPTRLDSNLRDLDTQEELTSEEVYGRFYRGEHHVILQTCLEQDGRLDWGLLFIVASPLSG